MKKTTLLFILLLVLLAHSAEAQRRGRRNAQAFRAYPSIGATASQIRGDELRGFKHWGLTAGVGAEVDLADEGRWKLSVEADFAQRGVSNNTTDPYGIIEFNLNYVDIPLTLHFTDPYGGITLGVGLVYGRLVQQPHGILIFSPNYFMPDTSDMTFLKNDFSAAIDLRFPIWRGLTFNLRWQHSLFPVKREWSFTEHFSAAPDDFKTWSNDCYNSSVSIRLLYVFGQQQGHRSPYKKNNFKHKKHRR
ncbi:MAG: outer membrane beta-barrel protein [Bacteroidales bacterium]|nr:outer membrane beta-barrel protein [Bacteroidales bacterium]